ncbi:MAG: DUF294 nucleotidyltransferase-like domain-containing protein [Rubrivivax sp.]
MPNAFNFTASPFDCLSSAERQQVRDNVDIAYHPEGQAVFEVGDAPAHLCVVIKGLVTQLDAGEVLATFGRDDCFDGRGLVAGRISSRFIAAEELLLYRLRRQTVKDLIASNPTFGALLFADLGRKLGALAERHDQHELQSLTLARVDEAYLRPVHVVDAGTDIVSVVRIFHDQRTTNVVVQGLPAGPGIFTTTTLQRAILDGRPLATQAVGEFASAPLVTVKPTDQLGDAMALLLRERVHRLVVMDDQQQIHGVLEALDLFSFLSNHSLLITVRIEQAKDLLALGDAAVQITRLIGLLHRGGTRIALMTRLVSQLNARLFERAWQMIAPDDLRVNSCLVVMGSEGRGEQLLKTDQDNGLLLRDGYASPSDLQAICQRFSDALATFGYPECKGRVMLNNPAWRGSQSEFSERARQWLHHPGEQGLMNLAIFMDAQCVAGDAALLDGARGGLLQGVQGNEVLIARFAAVIEGFGQSGWWGRLLAGGSQAPLDLKKQGIFPIVHGVRSLALSRQITATGTAARVDALVAGGALDATLGRELIECQHFLMGLKLAAGLAEIDAGQPVSGQVMPAQLGSLDRDLLKDTLAVVKRFKEMLRVRLRLDAL